MYYAYKSLLETKMKIFRNYSKSTCSPGGIYILSAVRTPIGLLNGVLSEFRVPQLGAFAIKEALHRAAVPVQDLQNVFLRYASSNDCCEEIIKRTGLGNTTEVSLMPTCGMKSLLNAVKLLQRSNNKVCLAGGMDSITFSNDSHCIPDFTKTRLQDATKLLKCSLVSLQDRKKYAEQDYDNFIQAKKNGAFYEEILKINFKKKGQQILVANDEMLRKHDLNEEEFISPVPGDGAVVITFSTEDYLKCNGLVPLVEIISFAEEFANAGDLASAQIVSIEKALKAAECQCEEVGRWEMVFSNSDIMMNCRNYFNINVSQVNKDGGVFSTGHPLGLLGVRAVCHLVHSLSPGKLGCATSCDFNGTASTVVVKKLEIKKSSKPQLTLYTKHPCPLCDELKRELKPFEGRFSLVEVDIEAKEGLKYKELYQYEIPVLFLDGIFLCKHRLNVEHFSRRLLASERAA